MMVLTMITWGIIFMKKLKKRLDAFSDAIIAIIITIIVLELPIHVVNGTVDYVQLFRSVGIYIVSFCFVANLWYQHAITFEEVDHVTNRDVVMDLMFLMLLSLVPTFTRLMSTDPIRSTVMLYGILYLLITIVFHRLANSVIKNEYQSHEDLHRVYNNIYGSRNGGLIYIIIVALIILGYFAPRIAMVMYIIIPIRSFLANAREREELNDVGQMSAAGRKQFINMSDRDKMRYSRMVRAYMNKIRHLPKDDEAGREAAWKEFSRQATKEFNVSEEVLSSWFHRYYEAMIHQHKQGLHQRQRQLPANVDQLPRQDREPKSRPHQ